MTQKIEPQAIADDTADQRAATSARLSRDPYGSDGISTITGLTRKEEDAELDRELAGIRKLGRQGRL